MHTWNGITNYHPVSRQATTLSADLFQRCINIMVDMRQETACLRVDTLEGCDEEEMTVDGGRESKADG